MNRLSGHFGTSRIAVHLIIALLPTLAWSVIYRSPKVVLDPLILLAVEPFLFRWFRLPVRCMWLLLCGVALLLEWNIFPESYGFYLSLLPGVAGTPHGGSIIAALLLLAIFALLPRPEVPSRRRCCLLVGAAAIYLGMTLAKASPWGRENLVWMRVPALRAVQVMISDGDRLLRASIVGPGQSQITHRLYDMIRQPGPAARPPKILIVLLEAWGETPKDLRAIARELAMQNVGRVEYGYNRYHGSTLPSEIRELCGRNLDFQSFDNLGGECLPHRLAAEGYQSTAFHGYDGFFYSRNIVYPALGFQRIYFRTNLARLPECPGAFPGTCDDSVAGLALAELARPGKRLVYMMSLTAHEPVSPAVLAREYVTHAPTLGSPTQSQRINRALVWHIVEHLGRRLPKGTLVYFGGDHNPPSESETDLPKNQVPYIMVRLFGRKTDN